MKHFLALLLIFSMISCHEEESFQTIDAAEFNKKISPYIEIKTPEQLILFYYDYPQDEGKPEIKITKRKVGNQVYEITLIHDHLSDDCQRAEKIIMTAKKIGQKWKVEKILKNWKCREGRGSTDWGTGICG